jgi:hypothetical protein
MASKYQEQQFDQFADKFALKILGINIPPEAKSASENNPHY